MTEPTRAGPRRAEAGDNIGVRVLLPRALVDLFPGSVGELRINAGTVDELIHELDARWPGMRDRLVDTTPAIRRHLNVFVDGERSKLDTALKPGTSVFILTAMSGG